MQKMKIGHRAKFREFSRDFTPYFHFRCVARATFDRNLIHSADACVLVMACVGYSRAQLKTLSSFLKIRRRAKYPHRARLGGHATRGRVD